MRDRKTRPRSHDGQPPKRVDGLRLPPGQRVHDNARVGRATGRRVAAVAAALLLAGCGGTAAEPERPADATEPAVSSAPAGEIEAYLISVQPLLDDYLTARRDLGAALDRLFEAMAEADLGDEALGREQLAAVAEELAAVGERLSSAARALEEIEPPGALEDGHAKLLEAARAAAEAATLLASADVSSADWRDVGAGLFLRLGDGARLRQEWSDILSAYLAGTGASTPAWVLTAGEPLDEIETPVPLPDEVDGERSPDCQDGPTEPLTKGQVVPVLRDHGFSVYPDPYTCAGATDIMIDLSNILFFGPNANEEQHDEITAREGHLICSLRTSPIYGDTNDVQEFERSAEKVKLVLANLECTLYPEQDAQVERLDEAFAALEAELEAGTG